MARALSFSFNSSLQIREIGGEHRVYQFESLNFSLTEPSYAYVSFRQVDGSHRFTRRLHVMGIVEGFQRLLSECGFEVISAL